MDEQTSIFQYVVIGILLVVALLAVIVFALQKRSEALPSTQLSVWGEMEREDFEDAVEPLIVESEAPFEFQYQQISSERLEEILVEALAYGGAPDLLLYPETTLLRVRGDLLPIPYESFPLRNFRDSFVEAGEVFAAPNGIYALPISVDPLVMYWNRTLLSGAGIATPPAYWGDIPDFVDEVGVRNGTSIERAAIALGTFSNIANAADIFSLLLLQSGNPIAQWSGNGVESVLAPKNSRNASIVLSVVRFYTEFADPDTPTYTWNSALPEAQSIFATNNLGLYIGFASEIRRIRSRNPNLNFDVTSVPQIRDEVPRTYAHVLGIAVLERSSQLSEAVRGAILLSNRAFAESISSIQLLPPARRDLLQSEPSDAYMNLFYRAAVRSVSWPDVNLYRSYDVFETLVDDVTSGRLRGSDAIEKAHNNL
ncbi:MAG: ABC transporter substrate-binding protein [Candidatus Paceibacterota bacterium]